VCGGTGFYIDALLGRITLPDVPANKKLREKLEKKTVAQLYAILQKMDPRRAKHIDKHNPVRLVRAIEIAKVIGKVPNTITPYDRDMLSCVRWIGLKPNNAILRKKIHARLILRMRQGMIKEAKQLHAQGLLFKRMEQLGLEYRYLAHLLQKRTTKSQMLIELERDIWRYARRQMTYWRRNKDIAWFSSAKEVMSSHIIGDRKTHDGKNSRRNI
jgi:tRNA dimethylallyltransferase